MKVPSLSGLGSCPCTEPTLILGLLEPIPLSWPTSHRRMGTCPVGLRSSQECLQQHLGVFVPPALGENWDEANSQGLCRGSLWNNTSVCHSGALPGALRHRRIHTFGPPLFLPHSQTEVLLSLPSLRGCNWQWDFPLLSRPVSPETCQS